jgi:NADH:ubiquinone oxidoreductase subunit K
VLLLALLLSLQFTAVELAMFGSALRGFLGALVFVPVAGAAVAVGVAILMTRRVSRAILAAYELQQSRAKPTGKT